MHPLNFSVFATILTLGGLTLALPYAASGVDTIKSSRSANTCADPSLAQTVFQVFIAGPTVHALNFRHAYENANTRNGAIIWGDIQPAFRAWPTQQNFTVPLFQLGRADRMEYIFKTGIDAQTPPVVSGFSTDVALIAWVYNSQVCGSVPLMSTALATATDHYFTTSAFEHDSLISDGWADGGVVAFVLPLYDP